MAPTDRATFYTGNKRMPTLEEQKEISSAEMTAFYRSAEPLLSGDQHSIELASTEGIQKAKAFIHKYNYPLVNRKISLRAGYCLHEAIRLLNNGGYDSCISFASGFSLLTYYIKQQVNNTKIQYFDTDLAHMIIERNRRIKEIGCKLDSTIIKEIQSKALDLENAYKQGLSLKDVFPTCHKPMFIIEGVIYFLSQGCVDWLMEQIAAYQHSAIIMDYWPEDMQKKSSLFSRVYKDINLIIPEQTKSFWDHATVAHFKRMFPSTSDLALSEVEHMMLSINHQPPIPTLVDQNQYFPLKMITAEKKKRRVKEEFPYAKL